MIYPSADTIEDRVGSRYSLVVLAAKRAKQIKEGSPVLIDTASTNPLTIALEEIAAGKVTIAPPSAAAAELGEAQITAEPPAAVAVPIGDEDTTVGDEAPASDLGAEILAGTNLTE